VGAYDCVCMLTGVSLRPTDAVVVLLRQRGEQSYSPIALPVFGGYDSMGGVDAIDEDANAGLLVDFFAAQLQTGRFVAVDYFNDHLTWPEPSADYFSVIDGLIGLVERNTTMWRYWGEGAEPLVSIDGDPVVFALLARSIWDAIVESAAEPPGSVASLLETAFGGDAIAHELYDDHLGEVASALRAFAVVNDFIATHGLSWTPPGAGRYSGDYDQHFGEMVEYLHRARVDWHDNPAIQTGLDPHRADHEAARPMGKRRAGTCEKGRANVLIDLGRACAAEGWGGVPSGEEVPRF
jgi:hypothetical protein